MMSRIVAMLLLLLLVVANAMAAPKSESWARWLPHDEQSRQMIDHSDWGRFLDRYLVVAEDGINRLRYGAVDEHGLRLLTGYLGLLAAQSVSSLRRAEQRAYWINLYNALTVKVVLDHFPVTSIRDIAISPGWFSVGPWAAKQVTIEGVSLSLNDIEHRILRPIWPDPRGHYAVNCASIGCPNLQPEPFTSANLEPLLERAARTYINHPRGVDIEGGRLRVSSIYHWFAEDFTEGVMAHLRDYAEVRLAAQLATFADYDSDHYDWRLNIATPQ